MSAAPGEISIHIEFHRRHWWPLAPLEINGLYTYDMVIDSGTGLSCIGALMRDHLLKEDLIKLIKKSKTGSHLYLLSNLKIQGQSIPDLQVRFSERVTEVGAYGLLGINFLSQFKEVHFYPPTRLLVLVR